MHIASFNCCLVSRNRPEDSSFHWHMVPRPATESFWRVAVTSTFRKLTIEELRKQIIAETKRVDEMLEEENGSAQNLKIRPSDAAEGGKESGE